MPDFARKRLDGRHIIQNVLSNGWWLFLDRFIRMGVGLFVGVWVARYLGPGDFGQLNYSIAIVALFGAIANLGMDGIVIREIVRSPEQKNEILGAAFLLKFLAGCVAFLFAIITVRLLRPEDTISIWMVAIVAAGLIFQSIDVIDLWFQSQMCSKYTVCARGLAYLISAALKIWLILVNRSLVYFAWASLAEVLFACVGLLFVYRLSGGRVIRWVLRFFWLKALVVESLPLLFSALAVILYMRLDLIMLSEMVGDYETGIYTAATRVSEVWYFVPTVLVASVSPAIIRLRENDFDKYTVGFNNLYFILAWVAIGISLPLSLLSSWVVGFLYGADFAFAGDVLAIHLWASPAVFLGVASGQYLLIEGLQIISFYRTLIGLICNVVLNIILIPKMGAMGAAIATVISYFIAVFSVVFFKETRKHAINLLMSLSWCFFNNGRW